MMERETIANRLEYCASNKCDICQQEEGSGFPWIDGRCYGFTERLYDAIALLKAQEPRLLALDEIHGDMTVWLEDVDKADVILAITESEFYALHGLVRCFITSDNRRIAPSKREYGIRWRAWTSEPTDEMRKAVKWDG